MAEDETRLRESVERAEAARARRIERDGLPPVGSPDVEDLRLLSVIVEATLDVDGEFADDVALRLLDHWDYEIARRAVDLYARQRPTVVDAEDLATMATTLVEADRIAAVRSRARAGDAEAARELVAIKRALRRGLER